MKLSETHSPTLDYDLDTEEPLGPGPSYYPRQLELTYTSPYTRYILP